MKDILKEKRQLHIVIKVLLSRFKFDQDINITGFILISPNKGAKYADSLNPQRSELQHPQASESSPGFDLDGALAATDGALQCVGGGNKDKKQALDYITDGLKYIYDGVTNVYNNIIEKGVKPTVKSIEEIKSSAKEDGTILSNYKEQGGNLIKDLSVDDKALDDASKKIIDKATGEVVPGAQTIYEAEKKMLEGVLKTAKSIDVTNSYRAFERMVDDKVKNGMDRKKAEEEALKEFKSCRDTNQSINNIMSELVKGNDQSKLRNFLFDSYNELHPRK